MVYDVNDLESFRSMERLKREVERVKDKVCFQTGLISFHYILSWTIHRIIMADGRYRSSFWVPSPTCPPRATRASRWLTSRPSSRRTAVRPLCRLLPSAPYEHISWSFLVILLYSTSVDCLSCAPVCTVKHYETSTSAAHRQVLQEAFVYIASKMSAPPGLSSLITHD